MTDLLRPVQNIAAGIIRRGDEVLLVQQQGADDPVAVWSLPGGVAEPGEVLSEALVREVREETGLRVVDIGPLAYVVQHDNRAPVQLHEGRPGTGYLATAFVFEVTAWAGKVRHADPDGYVLNAEFVPVEWAVADHSRPGPQRHVPTDGKLPCWGDFTRGSLALSHQSGRLGGGLSTRPSSWAGLAYPRALTRTGMASFCLRTLVRSISRRMRSRGIGRLPCPRPPRNARLPGGPSLLTSCGTGAQGREAGGLRSLADLDDRQGRRL